jgi:hypothetical protein
MEGFRGVENGYSSQYGHKPLFVVLATMSVIIIKADTQKY